MMISSNVYNTMIVNPIFPMSYWSETKGAFNSLSVTYLTVFSTCTRKTLETSVNILITKLCTLNLKIPIEMGRWHNIAKEDRICTLTV